MAEDRASKTDEIAQIMREMAALSTRVLALYRAGVPENEILALTREQRGDGRGRGNQRRKVSDAPSAASRERQRGAAPGSTKRTGIERAGRSGTLRSALWTN